MSAEAGSPITTYFRVCDGVRVRFADTKADSDVTVLLLAPWPETLWAFRRIWDRVSAVGRVVAIDLPGFGHSDGRPELIAPDAAGAFLAGLIDEWGLGAPHVVGPDVGTAAALFLGARHLLAPFGLGFSAEKAALQYDLFVIMLPIIPLAGLATINLWTSHRNALATADLVTDRMLMGSARHSLGGGTLQLRAIQRLCHFHPGHRAIGF